MGYGIPTLRSLARWIEHGWIGPGCRIIEFGAQEFYGDVGANRVAARDFLGAHGKDKAEIATILGSDGQPTVSAIYRAIGIDYTSIDVGRVYGSIYFDLNTFCVPQSWLGSFDFVHNQGTIEHLVNPINGFHVAHDMVKPGGVIRHSGPLTGKTDHGFVYCTTKFYTHLQSANGYEVLSAEVWLQEPTPFADPLFRDAPGGLQIQNVGFEFIVRKTKDQAFVFPADHPFHGDGDAIGEQLNVNMGCYAGRRLSGDARRD
jgi:SAM-dependent methyltransferase